MRNLRLIALALVACSTAAFALACGGDDVAAVPDASDNDATAADTGADDTGTNPDTGTDPDTGTAVDGGTDGSATTGIVCSPTNCTERTEVCCAPKSGTDTCKAVPDGGFGRICATNESEFYCSTTDSCGGGNSRCCARWPKNVQGDGGLVYTATCQTQGCAPSGQTFAVTLCTPNGKYGCGDAGNTCKPLVEVDGGPIIPPGYYACQP